MPSTTTVIADPDSPTILITRWFDAPRRLVWEATTKPEYLRRWWGLCVSEMTVCEVDLRVGGKWRHVLRFPNGEEHGFGGVYKEIDPEARVVRTHVYDPYPDAEALETSVMTEVDGRTKVEITIRHKTLVARNAHLQSGMEHGLRETHDRLDEVLAAMRR